MSSLLDARPSFMKDQLRDLLSLSGHDRPDWVAFLDAMGVQTKTDLLLHTDSANLLADLQERLSKNCTDVPEVLAANLRQLALKSRLDAGGFPEPSPETQSPVLFTAPHSIYLKREGHVHHLPEWHTSDLARKFAKAVKGAFLTWTREEEKRNKELFDIAGEPDGTNRDPNFTPPSDLGGSPWTRELQSIRGRFGPRPCLHVDLHGCRNPRQGRGSHVVVGLRAMELRGKTGVQELRQELQTVLSVVLKGFTVSVNPQKNLTGAWDPEDDRCTLTQQSLSDEGGSWTHAVQLEMCAKLRKLLSESTALQAMLAQGLLIAWVMACRQEHSNGWLPARTQCIDLLKDWMVRCTDFHSHQDIANALKPKRKPIKVKSRSTDESEEEPERLSANSEPVGILCNGPNKDTYAQFNSKSDEVWAKIWEGQREAAIERYPAPAPTSDTTSAHPGKAESGNGDGRSEEETRLFRELSSWHGQGDRTGELTALMSLTVLAIEKQNRREAERDADKALALARELRDTEKEAEAIRLKISACLLDENAEGAEKLLKQEDEGLRKTGNPCAAAEAFMLLTEADVLARKGWSREAQKLSEKAVCCAKQQTGSKQSQAAAAEALATHYLALGNTNRALKSGKEAARLYQELGNKKKSAHALRTISMVYNRTASAQEAMDNAHEALSICLEVGDRVGEVASWNAIASAHLLGDGAADALDTAWTAAKLAKEIENPHEQVDALDTIVNAHLSLGDHQEALTSANEMLNLSRTLEDVALMSRPMETIMGIYAQGKAGTKALLKANAQLRFAKASGKPKLWAAALQWMATAQHLCQLPEEALQSAVQAREKLREANDRKGEALACNMVATYLADLRGLDQALKVCDESVELLQGLGDTLGIAQTIQLKVDLSCQRGPDGRALAFAWEQEKLFQEAGYKEEQAGALLRISDLCWKVKGLKGIEEALIPVKSARAIYQDLDEKELEAKALLTRANLFSWDKRFTLALKEARDAQEICQAAESTRGEADALLTIASVHLAEMESAAEKAGAGSKSATKQGQRDAILAAEDARKSYDSLDDAEGLAAALQLISQCHWVSDNADEALQAAQEALEIHERLDNTQGVAATLLWVTRAQILLRDFDSAIASAREAETMAADIGNANISSEARQLLDLLDLPGIGDAGNPKSAPGNMILAQVPTLAPGLGTGSPNPTREAPEVLRIGAFGSGCWGLTP